MTQSRDSGYSANGAGPGSRPFASILTESSAGDAPVAAAPYHLEDLNLDQVLAALTRDRDRYELPPFFYAPLHDESAVRYRHEALRDLERPELRGAVNALAQAMGQMREHLGYMSELRHPLQQQAWYLDTIAVYCDGVRELADALERHELGSRAFGGLRTYVCEYVASPRFRALGKELESVREALAGVRFAVRIYGAKVTVTRYEDEPDYSVEVRETFDRFRQRDVDSHLLRLREYVQMNHVEEQILDRVAWLHPEAFGALDRFCSGHRDFLDETVARFDREVQFYLAYLELAERLKRAGLPFCYPQVSARDKHIDVEATFDLALALRLADEDTAVVCNDLRLQPPERVLVITGPNNGGKTTFARTFGQLHYLASLGLPVPGRRARLVLPDRIFTHFEREEDIETLRGKFDDEVVRVHEILKHASAESVIVMNESFSSTTLNDALYVGSEVMHSILDRGCLGVYVTFVDELASLDEATVSMVAQIVSDNPAERTFKIIRKPADGLAYAWAIAEKYGLTYERLLERVGA
jgi:DNA mismatch repair protein MutS